MAEVPSPATRPASIALDPPASRPVGVAAQKLTETLKEVKFKQKPLREAFDIIRQQAGINIVIAWYEVPQIGVGTEWPIDLDLTNVTVDEALQAIERTVSNQIGRLQHTARGNIVWIEPVASREFPEIRPDLQCIRVYEIADFLLARKMQAKIQKAKTPEIKPADPNGQPADAGAVAAEPAADTNDFAVVEEITMLVQSMIDEGSWKARGGTATISEFNGRLFINQTPENHARIERLLEQARKTLPSPATQPAAPEKQGGR